MGKSPITCLPGSGVTSSPAKRSTAAAGSGKKHGYLSLPLLVRPNHIIAVGNNSLRPDYDFAANVTLHLFSLEEGATAATTVYNMEGRPELTVRAERRGQKIHLQAEGAGENKPWSLLLRGAWKVKAVAGGRLTTTDGGSLILPDHYSGELTIELL